MNVDNIITYITITETKSLSLAAERLFVSQSTISTRLNALEKELGVNLIERSPGRRTIELTAKGEEFVPVAKQWISLHKDTNMWVNKAPNIKLNVGAIDSVNGYILSSLFEHILNNYSLYLDISTHSSLQIYESLESYNIDLGFTSRLIRNNNLIGEPIFSEKMVMISSPIYSSYADPIHPEDLDIKHEIFQDWGPNFLIWHDQWWDPYDNSKIIVDTSALIATCIDIPDTWSIVPLSVAHSIKKLKSIKISELLMAPDDRIYYQIKHRYPRPRSVKSMKIFEQILASHLENHQYLKIYK